LQLRDVRWPLEQPLHFAAGMQVLPESAVEGARPAQLQLQGSLTDKQGQLAISARQLPLQLAAPYLSAHLKPELTGLLDADAGLGWNGSAMVVQVAGLGVEQLSLRDKAAPVDIARLQLEQVQVNLARQQVSVGRLALQKPQLGVARDAEGRWMYEQWLPAAAASPAPQAPGKGPSRPWGLKLQAVEVDGGAIALRDEAPVRNAGPARSVSLDLSSLRLRLGAIEPLAAKSAPTPLELSAQVGSGRRVQAGSLSLRGDLGLAPLSVQGKLQAHSLPLHALEPYFADMLNVELVRADGHFTGQLRFASQPGGPELSVQGDVGLSDLRMRSALASPVQVADEPAAAAPRSAAGAVAAVLSESTADRARAQAATSGLGLRDELLAWKTLAVRGLDLQMQPAQPLRVSVRETALSDFFARVIVQRNGRINLQDIVKSDKSEQSLAQNTAPAADGAAAAGNATTAPSPVAASGPAPVVKVGPIVLTGGRVQFSDYFIQPNYSADLSELAGRLSAFSSEQPASGQAPQLADVELRGRAQGTASLEITGQVNPLAKPLVLDIRAQMRDLELPPLSPYSIKYAGHGIERGKLSMDVNYKIEPDGQLTARNKLVLHQLTFGEPVEGAPASLPVRLAVALLADRNGVIDLDLPVSGSLNDPQFRLAPVIFKIIGNLIMKAVTAPFSLLSGAFGGSSESGVVAFAPGRAQIDAQARESLEKVAASLRERPALKLTVVGEASEAQDREAWKQAELDRLLLAQKRRQVLRDGKSAESVNEVPAAEVPALTKALYSRSDFTKPRNAIGMAKDLPTDQMRSLLLAQITVPDDAMRELALARGVAVRDYLAQQQLPLERLFLGAPKLDSQEPQWSPRAQLSLSTR
jgi:stage V sporulation protein SpoVS